MTLEIIETLSKDLNQKRAVLKGRVSAVVAKVNQAKTQGARGIKSALQATAEAENTLKQYVEAHPELFESPRSRQFHNVKCGIQKKPGKVEYQDKGFAVKKIKILFPCRTDEFIQQTEKPKDAAVRQLKPAELKKIGAAIVGDGDHAYVKSVDSELEKMVDQLLDSATIGDNDE